MKPLLKILPMVLLALFVTTAVVMAQEGEVEAPFSLDWRYVIAMFVNSVLVVIAVQILKTFLPTLPGPVKQVLALVAGPVLMYLSTALSGVIGYPIDFTALIQLFAGLGSGLAAMGMFDMTLKKPG